MGTRGAVCLVIDGQEKTIYNHFDSYPGGLGQDVLTWLKGSIDINAVRALRPVPEGDPTPDDFARLAEFHDPGVSSGRDWYALLRRTQGDLAATMRAGLYEDAGDFPRDSLFCEWAYVADFDARRFEVYRGFQTTPPTDGRWVGKPSADDSGKYYPVQRIAAWPLDDLPESLDTMESGD